MFKKKKTIIWILIIVAVIFGGYKYFSKDPVTSYVTEDVTRGTLTQTVSSTGKFNSNSEVNMAFKTSGRVHSIGLEVGDIVKKGQKVAAIEIGILTEQLNQAEADIKAQKKTISDMVDKRDTTTKDQRDSQRAVLKKIEAIRDGVLRQMRETSIYSPMDGVVTQKNVDAGEMIAAGTTVVTISNPDDLVIESNIPEADIVKILVGQKAVIIFDALSEEEIFVAEVIEIYPAATVIQDVVFYKIKLKLLNPDARLKLGMSCDVDVLTSELNDVLIIPERAVKNEDGKRFVEILKADGVTIEKVYVEVGPSGDNGMIEIKNNLKEGEKVIVFSSTK